MSNQVQEAITALKKNNMGAIYAKDKDEATKIAFGMIPEKSSIGLGGSITLEEIGLLAKLRGSPNINLLDRYAPDLSQKQASELIRQSLLSDIYISGSNAITLEGEIINTDGRGNRVAALIFGPKKVIIIVGKNKIVKDQAAAFVRIRDTAAPMNTKRLDKKTPCKTTGKCEDCSSPERICRFHTIITKQKPEPKPRINVIIVDDDLGY